MEFRYFIKVGDRYEARKMSPPTASNQNFFKSFLLLIEEELENIRTDIVSLFPDKEKVHLSKPKHSDWKCQKKIETLIKLRQVNTITKDNVKALLQEQNFIMCSCGCKMFRTPLNVNFKKLGTNYIILDDCISVEYAFICESCVDMIYENMYYAIEANKNRRKDLLEQGYNFVPTDYGCWYHHQDGKPLKKPKDVI